MRKSITADLLSEASAKIILIAICPRWAIEDKVQKRKETPVLQSRVTKARGLNMSGDTDEYMCREFCRENLVSKN